MGGADEHAEGVGGESYFSGIDLYIVLNTGRSRDIISKEISQLLPKYFLIFLSADIPAGSSEIVDGIPRQTSPVLYIQFVKRFRI